MTFIHAIILGIVEGVTEFLPISSTGHLILASNLLGIPQTEAVKSFEIIIQLGAILAVVVLYAQKVFSNWELIKKIIVGFIPTGILGVILYKIVKTFLLGNPYVTVISLILGGFAILIIEYIYKKYPRFHAPRHEISYKESALSGVWQSIAMIPGVSRSAATIMGGLLMGISRTTITEFSFFLAVPTMAAATGLDILKNANTFSFSDWQSLLVGFVTSFVVAIISIRWLLKYVKHHTFIGFGMYRIIAGLVFFFLIS